MADDSPAHEDLSEEEFHTLLSLSRRILWDNHETRRRLQNVGIQITPQRFYNEIPSMDEIETSFEALEKHPFMFGFFKDTEPEPLINVLAPYAGEFDPPLTTDKPDEYCWNNTQFSHYDAYLYYSLIRAKKPASIVEIGSGHSSMIARDAIHKNGSGDIHIVEPYPMEFLRQAPFQIRESFVQDLEPDYFNDILRDGDMLFIDSTHTVKMGSDCVHIYLRLLPKIRRNIYVHVHDIMLPRGLNKMRAMEKHVYWTEQHLLAAYMLDNPKVQFMLGTVFLWDCFPELLDKLAQNHKPKGIGGSFWFELLGGKTR